MTTTPQFTLPPTWEATPYGGHWSFAYTTERGEREDYDFRVELHEGMSEAEERGVIGLLEAAPKLLSALQDMVKWAELHGLTMAPLITGGQAECPVIINARTAIAAATGKEAA